MRMIKGQHKNRGVTLPELLVALAIFSIVMAAIATVFTRSTRAARQGHQALMAFEESSGVLAVIERDLMRAFTDREHGDYYSLTGTPIGLSFIGVASNTADDADVNLSRVTYVVYANPTAAFEDVAGNTVVTYSLLRYVEPGVSDLNAFPIDWYALPSVLVDNLDPAAPPGIQSDFETFEVDGVAVFGAPWGLTFTRAAVMQLDAKRRAAFAAKQREWWIRIVSGEPRLLGELASAVSPVTGANYTDRNGDGTIDIWDVWVEDGIIDADENWADYVIADNVRADLRLTLVPPLPPVPEPVYSEITNLEPFFRYGRVNKNGVPALDEYWHTLDAIIPEGIVAGMPHLPEVVELRFTMMLESPYPAAPDFDRTFKKLVDLPAAYIRPKK
ncbi:MAG TPA: type II secretion system protein [Candidatus Hydrogenedentes bacterium]|nr:type II secretion system protein [Candidatus Hydrogenedentota bacterium]